MSRAPPLSPSLAPLLALLPLFSLSPPPLPPLPPAVPPLPFPRPLPVSCALSRVRAALLVIRFRASVLMPLSPSCSRTSAACQALCCLAHLLPVVVTSPAVARRGLRRPRTPPARVFLSALRRRRRCFARARGGSLLVRPFAARAGSRPSVRSALRPLCLAPRSGCSATRPVTFFLRPPRVFAVTHRCSLSRAVARLSGAAPLRPSSPYCRRAPRGPRSSFTRRSSPSPHVSTTPFPGLPSLFAEFPPLSTPVCFLSSFFRYRLVTLACSPTSLPTLAPLLIRLPLLPRSSRSPTLFPSFLPSRSFASAHLLFSPHPVYHAPCSLPSPLPPHSPDGVAA